MSSEKESNDLTYLNEVTVKSYIGHTDDVTCCTFTSDWTILATGGYDFTLRTWNILDDKLLLTLKGHTKIIKCVSFSYSNEKLASGDSNAFVIVWDAHTGTKLNELKGHFLSVESVSFSHTGNFLCSTSWDHTAILWDLMTSSALRVLDNHSSVVQCCIFSWNGNMLATGAWDYEIHVYFITEIIAESSQNTSETTEKILKSKNNVNRVSSRLEFLENHEVFSREELNSSFENFQLDSLGMQRIKSAPSSSGNNTSVKKKRIQSAGPAFLCNTEDNNIVVNSKNKRIQSAHYKKRIKPKNMVILKKHTSNIKCLCFSINGLLASASWDCTICLWNPVECVCLFQLVGHDGYVQACTFSPNGLLLASASDDETVKVWDIEKGKCSKTLEAHTEEIHQLAFTKNGTLLSSGPEELSLAIF